MKVLVSDPQSNWISLVKEIAENGGYLVEVAQDGRDAQLKIYKDKFDAVVLDVDTQRNTGLEVLKYINLNASYLRVVLTVSGNDRLEELDLTAENLKKMGAADVLIKPFGKDALIKALSGEQQFSQWRVNAKGVNDSSEGMDDKEISASDDEFTRIKIDEFFAGKLAIFDIYIRLGKHRYIKVLKQGDSFEQQRISKYKEQHNVEFLYFKTQDRVTYIKFMNQMMDKIVKRPRVNVEVKVNTIKNITEKYVEEIYTRGLTPQMIEEGKKVSENVYSLVHRNGELYKLLVKFEEFNPAAYSHSSLVVFFSSVACSNVDWASKATTEKIVMGATLHDIGKLKMNKALINLRQHQMNEDQLNEYKKHPDYGLEMVANIAGISTQVKQIIHQHHECMDGSGFPKGLPSIKIYPLAKIVSFVDACVNLMVEKRIPIVHAFKELLMNKKEIAKYDPTIIRAFMKSFLNPDVGA